MVFIAAPKVDQKQLPHRFWQRCDMKYVIENDNRGNLSNLWFCCIHDLDLVILSYARQQIIVEVVFGNKFVRISDVYTDTNYAKRRDLWFGLLQVCDPNTTWAIIGDFNYVTVVHEKRSSNPSK